VKDVDGSLADLGIYGGPEGGSRDLDDDGEPDWFWPGTIDDASFGYDPAGYGCDDVDPSVGNCAM
jgi:hypothetical protein